MYDKTIKFNINSRLRQTGIISCCIFTIESPSFHVWWFVVCRYQPVQPSASYEMANTQEEPETNESCSEVNIDMLPPPADRFTIRNLFCPSNTEPSRLSGSTVNVCTSILGKGRTHTHTHTPG